MKLPRASPIAGLHDTLGDVRRGIALPWTCPPILRFSAVDTLRNDMLHYYNIAVAARVCVLVSVSISLPLSLSMVSLYSCTRTGAICPQPRNAKCLRQTARDRIRGPTYARILKRNLSGMPFSTLPLSSIILLQVGRHITNLRIV